MVIGKRFKAYGVLAGVFLLGAIAGAGTFWAVSQRQMHAFASGERRAFEHRRLEALSRKLDLSDEQREKVRVILERHRAERDEVMRGMLERCGDPAKAHRDKLKQEIDAVLTPEQRVLHDELVRERDKRGPPDRRRRP